MTKSEFIRNYLLVKLSIEGYQKDFRFQSENFYSNYFNTTRQNARYVLKSLQKSGALVVRQGSRYTSNHEWLNKINNLPMCPNNSKYKLIKKKKKNNITQYEFMINYGEFKFLKIILINNDVIISDISGVVFHNLRLLIFSQLIPDKLSCEFVPSNKVLYEDSLSWFSPSEIAQKICIYHQGKKYITSFLITSKSMEWNNEYFSSI